MNIYTFNSHYIPGQNCTDAPIYISFLSTGPFFAFFYLLCLFWSQCTVQTEKSTSTVYFRCWPAHMWSFEFEDLLLDAWTSAPWPVFVYIQYDNKSSLPTGEWDINSYLQLDVMKTTHFFQPLVRTLTLSVVSGISRTVRNYSFGESVQKTWEKGFLSLSQVEMVKKQHFLIVLLHN